VLPYVFIEIMNYLQKMAVSFVCLILLYRDGQSGKITVDDYGARTGKSPGRMRQLNINGPLYVGK
jgi:hypothetical protein